MHYSVRFHSDWIGGLFCLLLLKLAGSRARPPGPAQRLSGGRSGFAGGRGIPRRLDFGEERMHAAPQVEDETAGLLLRRGLEQALGQGCIKLGILSAL